MPKVLQRIDLWAFVACVVLFVGLPQVDIAFSQLFFVAGEFVLDEHPLVRVIYRGTEYLALAIALALLLAVVLGFFRRCVPCHQHRHAARYLLLAMLLGPGLLINLVLKDHVGRARPEYVEPFGGQQAFTPAFVISQGCDSNCSFVSGHASAGFFLLAVGLVSAHRRRWIVAGLLAGGIIGLTRIAMGGHFLSDVVFSGFAVWASALAVHAVLTRAGLLPSAGGGSSPPQ